MLRRLEWWRINKDGSFRSKTLKPKEGSSGEITTLPSNRKKSTIEAVQADSTPQRVSPKCAMEALFRLLQKQHY
jgi:hypothetical protein